MTNCSPNTGGFTQSELNFYGLVKIALLLDCEHIMEWECIQAYGHSSIIRLNKEQQSDIYHKSKKAVFSELKRSDNAAILQMVLASVSPPSGKQ